MANARIPGPLRADDFLSRPSGRIQRVAGHVVTGVSEHRNTAGPIGLNRRRIRVADVGKKDSQTTLDPTQRRSDEGSNNLLITETDVHGWRHKGFRDKVQQALTRLSLETPGNNLYNNVLKGPMKVTIQPSFQQTTDGAITKRNGNEIIIQIDDDITDTSFHFLDTKRGKIIPDPFHDIVAHELIHAFRIAHSVANPQGPPSSPGYPNLEEQVTVSYENIIRKSFNEPLRPSYDGIDNRGMEGPPSNEVP
jgi:hypothetical protein